MRSRGTQWILVPVETVIVANQLRSPASVGAVYDRPYFPSCTEERAVIDRPYKLLNPPKVPILKRDAGSFGGTFFDNLRLNIQPL